MFLCHPNDSPDQVYRYDPFVYVEAGQLGVVQIAKDTADDRGWDVVKFDSPKRVEKYGDINIWVADVTYMEPVGSKKGKWPARWETKVFKPMTHPQNKKLLWTQKSFPLDNVVWSTEPKLDSEGNVASWRFPSAMRELALLAVDRVERWHQDNPNLEEARHVIDAGQGVRLVILPQEES